MRPTRPPAASCTALCVLGCELLPSGLDAPASAGAGGAAAAAAGGEEGLAGVTVGRFAKRAAKVVGSAAALALSRGSKHAKAAPVMYAS